MSAVNFLDMPPVNRVVSAFFNTENEAAVTKMNFEDAVSELVDIINASSPQDKALAVQALRCAIAANDRTYLRLISLPDEKELIDTVPI